MADRYEEYSQVILITDRHEACGVRIGMEGVIVHVHEHLVSKVGYEVDFSSAETGFLELITCEHADIKPLDIEA